MQRQVMTSDSKARFLHLSADLDDDYSPNWSSSTQTGPSLHSPNLTEQSPSAKSVPIHHMHLDPHLDGAPQISFSVPRRPPSYRDLPTINSTISTNKTNRRKNRKLHEKNPSLQTRIHNNPQANQMNARIHARKKHYSTNIPESNTLHTSPEILLQAQLKGDINDCVANKNIQLQTVTNDSTMDKLLGLENYDTRHISEFPENHRMEKFVPLLTSALPSAQTSTVTAVGPSLFSKFQLRCIHAIADMIVSPFTVLPIQIGVFTRPGFTTREAFTQKLNSYLKDLQRRSDEDASTRCRDKTSFDLPSTLLPPAVAACLSYVLGLIFGWPLGLSVFLTSFFLYFVFLGVMLFGGFARHWKRALQISEALSRYTRSWQLILDILFYRAPLDNTKAKHVRILPITLKLDPLTNAWDAAVLLSEKMCKATESKYSSVAMHFQRVSRDTLEEGGHHSRKCCYIPLWLWFSVCLLSTLVFLGLLRMQNLSTLKSIFIDHPNSTTSNADTTKSSNKIAAAALLFSGVLAGFSQFVLLLITLKPIYGLLRWREQLRSLKRDLLGGNPEIDEYPPLCGPGQPGTWSTNSRQGCFIPANLNQCIHSLDAIKQMPCDERCVTSAAATTTATDRHWRRNYHGNQKNKHNDQEKNILLEDERHDQLPKRFASNSITSSSSSSLNEDGFQKRGSDTSNVNKTHANLETAKYTLADPINRTAKEKMLRRQLLETCQILSILDTRYGNQPSRFFVSIDASDGSSGLSSGSLKRVAEFCKLLEKLLLALPVGSSGAVQWFLDPGLKSEVVDSENVKESQFEKKNMPLGIGDVPVPNLIVLLMCTEGGGQQPLNTSFPDLSKKPMFRPGDGALFRLQNSQSVYSVDVWQIIHGTCHLPIYLDEPTPGRLLCPNESDCESKCPRLRNKHGCSSQENEMKRFYGKRFQPSLTSTLQAANIGPSLLEFFLCDHPLADINCYKLRHLLTHMAFMGRLLKSDGDQPNTVDHQQKPNVLEVAGVWLCLLLHWPFHTIWLTLFMEEHFNPSSTTSRVVDSGPSKKGKGREGTKWSSEKNKQADSVNGPRPVYPDDTLSMLYRRVLQRLAPALNASQIKARSASIQDLGSQYHHHHHQQHHHPYNLSSQPQNDNNNNNNSNAVNETLRLCELASCDRSSVRLADFLCSTQDWEFKEGYGGPSSSIGRRGDPDSFPTNRFFFSSKQEVALAAGDIKVRDLIHIMTYSPFLNAQTRRWIRAFLSHKGFSFLRSESKELHLNKETYTSKNDLTSKIKESDGSVDVCLVRLKNGMPKKPLTTMTVNDVCNLVTDIVDMSFNQQRNNRDESNHESDSSSSSLVFDHPSPPCLSDGRSIALKKTGESSSTIYIERIRSLNISGAVLTVCKLDDLRNELRMNFGDYQLFSTIINHLKSIEIAGKLRVRSITPEAGLFKSPSEIAASQDKGQNLFLNESVTRQDLNQPVTRPTNPNRLEYSQTMHLPACPHFHGHTKQHTASGGLSVTANKRYPCAHSLGDLASVGPTNLLHHAKKHTQQCLGLRSNRSAENSWNSAWLLAYHSPLIIAPKKTNVPIHIHETIPKSPSLVRANPPVRRERVIHSVANNSNWTSESMLEVSTRTEGQDSSKQMRTNYWYQMERTPTKLQNLQSNSETGLSRESSYSQEDDEKEEWERRSEETLQSTSFPDSSRLSSSTASSSASPCATSSLSEISINDYENNQYRKRPRIEPLRITSEQ